MDREYHKAMECHPILGDDAFQNERSRELFNAVDELKRCGASQEIELPEIVIVGDQSVGKSSLLQSLTDIPFPVAGSLCTRFPTRIVSRRGPKERTKISIEPQPFSTLSTEAVYKRQARYDEFEKTFLAFTAQDFLSMVEQATQIMGISGAASPSTDSDAGLRSKHRFSEDTLKIEVQGPNRSHFAILDLPGNFQSITGDLTEQDMVAVKNMVKRQMSRRESLIVCVAAGPTDLANQAVFDMASKPETDLYGNRTIGVITKCDVTQDPSQVIDIAKNKTKPLHHGWFVVRNRSPSEVSKGITPHEHLEKERAFFDREPWNTIPEKRRGTRELKKHLANRLCARYQAIFPTMQREIHLKQSEAERALSNMGQPRATLAKKRAYLSDVASAFHSLAFQGLHGQYTSMTEDGMKLRMKVREANDTFAHIIKQRGHTVSFLEPLDFVGDDLILAMRSTNRRGADGDLRTTQASMNSDGPFGRPKTTSVGSSCPTTRHGFVPFIGNESGTETMVYFQSIVFRKPYQMFSFEELRLNDYMQDPTMSAGVGLTSATMSSAHGSLSEFSSPWGFPAPRNQSATPAQPAFGRLKLPATPQSTFGGSGTQMNSNVGFFGVVAPDTSSPFGSISTNATPKANNKGSGSQRKGGKEVSDTFKNIFSTETGTTSEQTATKAHKSSSHGSGMGPLLGSKPVNAKDTAEIYKWIQNEIKASRGTELQGTLNPNVLPILFHKQAQNWQGLAEAHFINIRDSVDIAVAQILQAVCKDEHTRQKIQALIRDSSRKQHESLSQNLTEHVNNLLTKHLQTNNEAFEHKVREARMRRFQTALRRYGRSNSYKSKISRHEIDDPLNDDQDKIVIDTRDTAALFAAIHMSNQQNLEDEIHDILQAYYEISRENFIEFVNVHVVERYLDDQEGPVFAFSPVYVGKLTDEEVEYMAAEDSDMVKHRADMEATLERLSKAEGIVDRCMRTQIR